MPACTCRSCFYESKPQCPSTYVYSNSRNDVPRVAKRYGTIAAYTRHRASVPVVFEVFCVHMYSFAGLIRRTPPRRSVTLQSPTATLIPLFSSSELTGCGYPGLLDRKNRSDMCPRWESNPRLPASKASTLSTRPGSPIPLQRAVTAVFILPDTGTLLGLVSDHC